jgi:hypothetical protein
MSKHRRTKYTLLLLMLLFAGVSNANDKQDERWKQIQERIKYERPARPEQPGTYYIDPPYLEEGNPNSFAHDYYEPDDDDIQDSRAARFPTSGNNGLKQRIQRNGLPQVDDLSTPDAQAPDYRQQDYDDSRDYDPPNLNADFWKTLFIIIAVILLAILIYQIFIKTKDDADKVIVKSLDENADWDPTEVQEDELTRLLNQAIGQQNYRAGVRVYYTLILKELINKGWIKWEKKKTNYHYALELGSKKERPAFERSVFLFELVWYGDYRINQAQFDEIEPTLKNLYQRLKNG